MQPVHLDSIIVRHRSAADGPENVQVSLAMNGGAPAILGECLTNTTMHDQVFTDFGCVEAGPGMSYGFFQLRLQAFGSSAGAWYLDDLRIVGGACTANAITEIAPQQVILDEDIRDPLGRVVKGRVTPGIYFRGQRRVVIP